MARRNGAESRPAKSSCQSKLDKVYITFFAMHLVIMFGEFWIWLDYTQVHSYSLGSYLLHGFLYFVTILSAIMFPLTVHRNLRCTQIMVHSQGDNVCLWLTASEQLSILFHYIRSQSNQESLTRCDSSISIHIRTNSSPPRRDGSGRISWWKLSITSLRALQSFEVYSKVRIVHTEPGSVGPIGTGRLHICRYHMATDHWPV